ncbi:MAG: hypothetical protein GC129_03310 [Proteobacteria bacterium]|nr:hypothetical protein [Pseudomonadota bacterium]
MKLAVQLARHLWPWIFFFVFQGFFPAQEAVLTGLVVLIIGWTFWLEHQRRELLLLAVGIALGLFVEVVLGLWFRTQHWQYASLFGVPYWLPLVWGYGFVVMRRVGNLIVEEG